MRKSTVENATHRGLLRFFKLGERSLSGLFIDLYKHLFVAAMNSQLHFFDVKTFLLISYFRMLLQFFSQVSK